MNAMRPPRPGFNVTGAVVDSVIAIGSIHPWNIRNMPLGNDGVSPPCPQLPAAIRQ